MPHVPFDRNSPVKSLVFGDHLPAHAQRGLDACRALCHPLSRLAWVCGTLKFPQGRYIVLFEVQNPETGVRLLKPLDDSTFGLSPAPRRGVGVIDHLALKVDQRGLVPLASTLHASADPNLHDDLPGGNVPAEFPFHEVVSWSGEQVRNLIEVVSPFNSRPGFPDLVA